MTSSWRQAFPGSSLRLLVIVAMVLTCVHAVRPTASYRALELGGGGAAIGFIAASYAILAAVVAVPLGRSIDRLRPRWFLIGGIALIAVGALATAGAGSLVLLAVGQATLGLGQVASAIASQTLTAAPHDRISRDQRFARLTVATSAGQFIGPLLAGGVLQASEGVDRAVLGTRLVFVVCAVLAAVAAVVAVGLDPLDKRVAGAPTTTSAREPRSSIASIVRRRGMPLALTMSIVALTTIDILIAYFPVVGEARGIAPGAIGALLSLRAIAGLASRVLMTPMLRRLGRRRLLGGSMGAAGLAMIGVAFGGSAWLIAPFMLLVGLGVGVGSPMTMAWVTNRAPPGNQGTALGVRMTGNRIGQVLLPGAAGGLATLLGPGAVFVALAGILLAGSAWVRTSPLDESSP